VGTLSSDRVLIIWQRQHRKMRDAEKVEFLDSPEVQGLTRFEEPLVTEAIACHLSTKMALDHARWRTDGGIGVSKCRCSEGNIRLPGTSRKPPKKKRPKKPRSAPSGDLDIPSGEPFGGGPGYRRPPTGGVAKGW
jgi:hypothetical protein